MRPSLLAFLALADAALSASASALPTTQDGIRIGSLIARALSRRDPLPSSSSAPSGWPSGVSCDLTKAVMPQGE